MFKLEIKTDNDAFADDNRAGELARILRLVATRVERGMSDDGLCFDVNGNKVGDWSIGPD